MLNLRLVEPQLIVDITGLAELKQVERRGDELVLGACVTHADIEDGRIPDVTRGAMQGVAAISPTAPCAIAARSADRSAMPIPRQTGYPALSALGRELTLRSLAGARTVAMEDFIVGALESALRDGEIVETIHVPRCRHRRTGATPRVAARPGEFAHAIGAILIDPSAATARVVIGAIDAAPIVITNAAELFGGRIAGDYKDRFDARVSGCAAGKGGRLECDASPYSCERASSVRSARPPHEHDRTHREPARGAGFGRAAHQSLRTSFAKSSI
jgi:carbon-monoxide dehydrogenase medium subunit